MEITEVTRPSAVHIAIAFEKPVRAHNDTVFSIEPTGAGSRVAWTMTGQQTFMTKLMGLVKSMDKLVGPDFEKGLARLKATAENAPRLVR